jgi:hypothetical protein
MVRCITYAEVVIKILFSKKDTNVHISIRHNTPPYERKSYRRVIVANAEVIT